MDWPSTLSDQAVNIEAQRLVDQGNAAYRARDFATALKLYSELLTLKPGDPRGYYNRGIVYSKLRDFGHALRDFTEALRIEPNFQLALVNRAGIYGRDRRYQEAIDDYDRALRLKETDAVALFGRALAYRRLGDDTKALDDLTQVIRLTPEDATAYVERGSILAQLGQRRSAQRDLEAALKLDGRRGRVASFEQLERRSTKPIQSGEISTTRVIEEMAAERIIDDVLDIVKAACFYDGENPKRLQALATEKKWDAKTSSLRGTGTQAATQFGQRVVYHVAHNIAVAQSRIDGSGVYACSVRATLTMPATYSQLRAAFERRFKISSVGDAADGSELKTEYLIPHLATCDTRASLIGSPVGSRMTIWMWHGRRYSRAAQAPAVLNNPAE